MLGVSGSVIGDVLVASTIGLRSRHIPMPRRARSMVGRVTTNDNDEVSKKKHIDRELTEISADTIGR